MRTDAFPGFLVASLIVHAGLGIALYYGGFLTPVAQTMASAGFDAERVRAVVERMRAAEPVPVSIPVTQPDIADEPPSAVDTPREVAVGDRTSLAPSDLNAILDRPLEGYSAVGAGDTGSKAADDPGDLEKAFLGADEESAPGPGLTSMGVGRNKVARGGASDGKGSVVTGGFVIGGKGDISRSAVDSALGKRMPQMQNCYQAALLENPTLSGKLLLRWTVSKEGEVEEVLVESSQLENAELHSCVVQEISRTKFPKPEGGSIIIRYPLNFAIHSY